MQGAQNRGRRMLFVLVLFVWNDLDSLNISSTADGISNDERQTYMTLWAIEASHPLCR